VTQRVETTTRVVPRVETPGILEVVYVGVYHMPRRRWGKGRRQEWRDGPPLLKRVLCARREGAGVERAAKELGRTNELERKKDAKGGKGHPLKRC